MRGGQRGNKGSVVIVIVGVKEEEERKAKILLSNSGSVVYDRGGEVRGAAFRDGGSQRVSPTFHTDGHGGAEDGRGVRRRKEEGLYATMGRFISSSIGQCRQLHCGRWVRR